MHTIFDNYTIDKIENSISEIESMIRNGYSRDRIKKEIYLECFDEIFSIAHARIRNDKTKESLYMSLEDLRFATHEEVAKYRASRLKCGTLVEIGCGIGLQSVEFSKTCSGVIAIELDERKYRYALENFKKLGIKNVELVKGDALEVAKSIKKADIVFCDTERAAEEKVRRLSGLKPSVQETMKAYSHITKDFCIEVPPQIRDINLKCEKEYLSLNGKLNRLSLYFGSLIKSDFSAVILPQGFRVGGEQGGMPKSVDKAMSYIYEADDAVVKAKLLHKIIPKNVFLYSQEKQTLLTSGKYTKNDFFSNSYKVLAKCKPSYKYIIKALNKADAGSIILRARIKPEEYWAERKKYESKLSGSKKIYLFVNSNEALIAEQV